MGWRKDAIATEVQLKMQVGKTVQNVWCHGKSRDLIILMAGNAPNRLKTSVRQPYAFDFTSSVKFFLPPW